MSDSIHGRREARDRFIYDLLVGGRAADPVLLRQADIMGMDLTRPRAVVLLETFGPSRMTTPRSYSSGPGGTPINSIRST